jgi:energy-dependent translational throttle protein EttA
MSVDDKKIIFGMTKVSKVHKGSERTIIKDISLSFFYGAKIGILGLNGSGKSTILNIIAGKDKDFRGDLHMSEGYSVGMLEQEPFLDNSKTAKECVQEGVQDIVDMMAEFDAINLKFGEEMTPEEMDALIARQAEVQDKLDANDAWNLDDKLNYAMEALRCPPGDQTVENLSGGERRRVALCRLLLQKPDILLLDEPTNHLDAESVQWLERHLAEFEGTIIAVTHDRYFLDNVAGWILELDRGHGIPWEGNYSSWLDQKDKRLATEEKGESKRRKQLQRELEWVKMSPKGRHAKNKARIGAYEKMLNQEQDTLADNLKLYFPPGPRLGDVVIKAEGVAKSFGDKLLYQGLDFDLPRGGIVGIIGPNGAGKTTLFRMISGEDKPDQGTFTVGSTVKLGYMSQSRLSLDPDKTVFQTVSGGGDVVKVGGKEYNARNFVGRFNFTGPTQEKKVSELSGGERNRVQLALLVKEEANVILLDEPTNDLDVNTLRSLEEALENFGGCAVVISHDRWFLDRVATHILAFEGESTIAWFEGNYSDYEEDRKKRLGKEALTPKRIKYARLER